MKHSQVFRRRVVDHSSRAATKINCVTRGWRVHGPRLSQCLACSSHRSPRSLPNVSYPYSVEKPARQPDLWRTSLVAGLITIVGASLKFWYLYLDDLSRDRPNMFAQRVLEEGTGFFAFAVLIPAIV